MADYTNPVETTFELQRRSIEQSRETLEQTITFPTRVGEAAMDSLESQESMQRNVVEVQQEAIHSFLGAMEETFPGVETPTDDVREVVDDQYDSVLEGHAELFENLSDSLDESFDAYDEMGEETVEALDDLLDSIIEVHEELEDRSIEATEQVEAQFDELQAQVEDLQEQIESVSEDVTAGDN